MQRRFYHFNVNVIILIYSLHIQRKSAYFLFFVNGRKRKATFLGQATGKKLNYFETLAFAMHKNIGNIISLLMCGFTIIHIQHFLQKDLEDQELYKQLGYEIIDEQIQQESELEGNFNTSGTVLSFNFLFHCVYFLTHTYFLLFLFFTYRYWHKS